MVDRTIVKSVKDYLRVLADEGVHAERAVVFGSFARGEATEESDLDLVVIAPEFDGVCDRGLVRRLWVARGKVDSRIEPIPCGEKEWDSGADDRPVLGMARREGVVIGQTAPVASRRG